MDNMSAPSPDQESWGAARLKQRVTDVYSLLLWLQFNRIGYMEACRNASRQMWWPSKASSSDARFFLSFSTFFLISTPEYSPCYDYHLVYLVLLCIKSYEGYFQRTVTKSEIGMFPPGTEVEYGMHEEGAQRQMADRFATGSVWLDAERNGAMEEKQIRCSSTDREHANGFRKAYSMSWLQSCFNALPWISANPRCRKLDWWWIQIGSLMSVCYLCIRTELSQSKALWPRRQKECMRTFLNGNTTVQPFYGKISLHRRGG